MQCGADALLRDPNESFNLTTKGIPCYIHTCVYDHRRLLVKSISCPLFTISHATGIGDCVQQVLELNLPVLFLGGGGYHEIDTARCWSYLTALIVSYAKKLEVRQL